VECEVKSLVVDVLEQMLTGHRTPLTVEHLLRTTARRRTLTHLFPQCHATFGGPPPPIPSLRRVGASALRTRYPPACRCAPMGACVSINGRGGWFGQKPAGWTSSPRDPAACPGGRVPQGATGPASGLFFLPNQTPPPLMLLQASMGTP